MVVRHTRADNHSAACYALITVHTQSHIPMMGQRTSIIAERDETMPPRPSGGLVTFGRMRASPRSFTP